MKLMVSSYNVGSSWNKEEEEKNLRTYTLNHAFNMPAQCIITLADKDGSMLRKYKTGKKVELAGGVADDGGVETDETTETNSAAPNDMTLLPAVPLVNDAYYFGFNDQPGAMTINIGTAADPGIFDPPVITWEYSQGADAWAALGGVTDGTNSWMNAGERNIVWTIPGDWDTDEVGSISGKYWVRARLSAFAGLDTIPIGTQAWYNKIWIGPGKITLEDPDSTDVFFGRIKNVVGNTEDRTVTLDCMDWLDQLDEEIITYDMREKLGTTDLRQSMLRSDVDGDRIPVENNGGVFSLFDDGDYDDDGGMAFVNDAYNGWKVFLTVGMSGTNTWRFYPYDSTYTNADIETDNVEAVWVDNDTIDGGNANNDWELEYHFHVEVGNNTPSDFYVNDSITGMRLCIVWQIPEAAVGNHSHIEILENSGPSWIELARLDEGDHRHRDTWTINQTNLPNIVDNTGEVDIRFNMDRTALLLSLATYFIELEVDVTTTGYNLGITINDTINPNEIVIAIDPTAPATQLWEQVPYCVAKPIHLHFESATGIILGGDVIVPLTAADGDIEDTSGFSTRQHKNRTRLQIAQDEARNDKSVFWMALGTVAVLYQQTFGANTETMTDATPDSWRSLRDYKTVRNSYDVYGARIGDYEIFQQSQDADSIATYIATRSKVIKDTGLVSDASAKEIGTALAPRDADIQQMVGCTLSGFDTTYRLGTIVEITSSYLWATAAKDYIVTRWAYDSDARKTFLTMHPKSSIGLQEIESPLTEGARIQSDVDKGKKDGVVLDPVTHEVA